MNKMQINYFGRVTDIIACLVHEGYAVMVVHQGDGYEIAYKRPGDEEPVPEVEVEVEHDAPCQECANCKYRNYEVDDEPCCECSHGVFLKDRWEPAVPSEICCDNCKYCYLDYMDEPCVHCASHNEFVAKKEIKSASGENNCSNCVFRELDSDFFPCNDCCRGSASSEDRWEGSLKRCVDCAHYKEEPCEEPCNRCYQHSDFVEKQ